MFCTQCGAENADDAKFCKKCGASLARPSASEGQPQATKPAAPESVAQSPKPKPKHHKKALVIAVVILAVAAAAGGGAFWWKSEADRQAAEQEQQAAYDSAHAERAVHINIVAPNYASTATHIPLHVTGADLDGNAVDQTSYVGDGTQDLKLHQGSYQIAIPASPILADGSLYTVPASPISVTVGDGDATASQELDLAPIEDPTTVTDDMIASAKAAAEADPDDGGKADTLAQAAAKKRDDAVAAKKAAAQKQAEEEAAKQKATEDAAQQQSESSQDGGDGTKEGEGAYYRNKSASSSSSTDDANYPANSNSKTVHAASGSYCHYTGATLESDGNGGSYIQVNYSCDRANQNGSYYYMRIRVYSSDGNFSFYYPNGDDGGGDASPLAHASSGTVRFYPASSGSFRTNFAPEDVAYFDGPDIL